MELNGNNLWKFHMISTFCTEVASTQVMNHNLSTILAIGDGQKIYRRKKFQMTVDLKHPRLNISDPIIYINLH